MKIFLKRNPVIGLILFMLPGLIGGGLFSFFYNRLDPQKLQDYIHHFGYWAAGVFLLFFTVRTFFIFAPYYMMLVIGGSLFGRKFGLIYNFAAVFFSSTLAYVLSRLLRPTVQKKFHVDRYGSYVNLIENHGFKILLFMRLAIIFPFDLLNYAAGIAGMRYRKFILANALGVVPEVVFLTCFGQSLRTPKSVQFIVLSVILVLAVVLGYRYKNAVVGWIRSVH